MDSSQQIHHLHQQIAALQEENRQARKAVAFMEEKLLAQKMMLDDAVAYSTQLEVQVAIYQPK